ncbi:MFS transporter [cyanobacterium endosymbiont of Epithemia clementina EcSB]|uniref:MFS transporter n=1 Tax=cyanobacterium endosymbiont of Epithemia clementina EcSB TaxID=3034674 RepID=UPI0024800868|nr:glycoside-pentoside-hexuronide (GPH):cation symporter [cyanobacterium endosymbiont of Epithemia clementina EcSB]WGT67301.1 glycoside-pentoside-hexuronide (GPH):cation symporter [cyanobacterium endosymbiont of Epithemia clementina EcSB]
MISQEKELTFRTKFFYGIGELSGSLPSNILIFFFLFFLTNVAGLSPGLAGLMMLAGKVWDGINDPVIGWLSDHTCSRWGRRYPWMLFGAVPLGITSILLWVVPPTTNQALLFIYYGVVSFLFYISFTAVLLPYGTLSAELTQGYDERTSLISFRSAFSIGGSIFSLALAQIIFATIYSTKQQYLLIGVICGLLAMLMVYISVWGTYRRYDQVQQKYLKTNKTSTLSFKKELYSAFSNRPFLYVMGIYLCSWLSVQTIASILPFFIINCMDLSTIHITQMAITVQSTALFMLFVLNAISKKLEKKIIYFLGIPSIIIAELGLFFLQSGQVVLLYILAVMAGIGIATAYIVPWSMLPDVIDLDELNTGERREGIFFGVVVQLQKIGVALALFFVGQILDWSGYISSGEGVQPESALWAIRIIIGPISTGILLMGLVLAYFYPITRQVHQEILLKLSSHNIHFK